MQLNIYPLKYVPLFLKYVSQGIIGLWYNNPILEYWYNPIPAIIEIENKMSDQGEKKLIEEGAVFDIGALLKITSSHVILIAKFSAFNIKCSCLSQLPGAKKLIRSPHLLSLHFKTTFLICCRQEQFEAGDSLRLFFLMPFASGT